MTHGEREGPRPDIAEAGLTVRAGGRDVRQLAPMPCFDLFSNRLEGALHPINTDRDAVDERERLRVFG
jgi:hypothetical protein